MKISRKELRSLIVEAAGSKKQLNEQSIPGMEADNNNPAALKFKEPGSNVAQSVKAGLEKMLSATIDMSNYFIWSGWADDFMEDQQLGKTGKELGISGDSDPYTYAAVRGGKYRVVSGPSAGAMGKTFMPRSPQPAPEPTPAPPMASTREFEFSVAVMHAGSVADGIETMIKDMERLESFMIDDNDTSKIMYGLGNTSRYFNKTSDDYRNRPSNSFKYALQQFRSLENYLAKETKGDGIISGTAFDEAQKMFSGALTWFEDQRAKVGPIWQKVNNTNAVGKYGSAYEQRLLDNIIEFHNVEGDLNGRVQILKNDFADPASQAPGYEGQVGAGRRSGEEALEETLSRGALYRKRYWGRY